MLFGIFVGVGGEELVPLLFERSAPLGDFGVELLNGFWDDVFLLGVEAPGFLDVDDVVGLEGYIAVLLD